MITEMVVDNFKAFGSRQEVPLSPITLIFGGNSAGKSTLIQGLLALRQSIVPSEPGPFFLGRPAELVVRGGLVDLGSFDALIYRHDKSRILTLGVTTDGDRRPRTEIRSGSRFGVEWSFERKGAAITHINSRLLYQRESIDFPVNPTTGSNLPSREPTVDLPAELTDRLLGWATSSSQHHQIYFDDSDKTPLCARVRLSNGIPVGCIRMNPHHDEEVDDEFEDTPAFDLTRNTPKKERSVEDRAAELLDRWLRVGPGSVRHELAALTYLGPLRTPPERFNVLTGEQVRNAGISGERVVDLLARRPGLIRDVNSWFETLEIPYSAEIRTVSDQAVAGAIGEVHCLLLRDKRTNTEVSPTDVGFGVGQVLPVVVQSLLNHNGVLCIEQPEIHLHPGLQARLAEMFAHVVKRSRRSQFILETHSEHFILRLQRLIRRGELRNDQVSVLHVGYSPEGDSQVRRLRLGENGEFLDEWPAGFFDDRFEELFGD